MKTIVNLVLCKILTWLWRFGWLELQISDESREIILWAGKLTTQTIEFGPPDVFHINDIPTFSCFNRGDAFLILRSLSGEEVEVIIRKR